VEDIPADLARAIEHATKVNMWYENLASDEIPPQWMWPHDGELKDWFDQVKVNRKSGSSSGESADEEWEQNELTVGLRD